VRTAIGLGAIAVGVTGGSDTVAAASGDEQWELETNGTVRSSPTVIGNFVYVGSDDGNVYAVNTASAGVRWEFETGGRVRSSPTVVDGLLFVGTDDNAVYAVDTESGEEQWAFETDGDVGSSPTVVGGTVFVGSDDGNLYAIDASSGTEQWSVETGGAVEGSPVVHDGTVFVGSADGSLYAVATGSGETEWTFETEGPIRASPTVASGIVYAGSDDRNVYAVDAGSGQEEWSYETVGGLSAPTVGDGGFVRETLFIGDRTGTVYALNAELGGLRWSKDVGDDIRAAPTLVSGRLLIGNSSLYSLDPETGEENWSTDLDPTSAPTVWEGTLFIGAGRRSLYAVDGGTTQSSQGSRVMTGTLGHHSEWNHADQSIEIDTSAAPQTESDPEPETNDGSETEPSETDFGGENPSADTGNSGQETIQIAALGGVGLLATLMIGGVAYRWVRDSGTNNLPKPVMNNRSEQRTDHNTDPAVQEAADDAPSGPSSTAEPADADDPEAVRSDADDLLADAVDKRNAGNLESAIEQYTAAIELYTAAAADIDEEATTEIEETIAQAREDRGAAETAREAQTSIRESLQLGEESLQNAIVAHANGEYTLSKIRYRQAREEFDAAIEDAEASDVDPFSEAIEVPVGSDNSLRSEQLRELLGLSSGTVEALSEAGVETVDDLTTQATESDDETGRQHVTVVAELLEDGTINDELAARLTALYWWHNEETHTITDLEAVEARYEQAAAGYEASR
jgi:outer membrane protein assembly factor BamB/tetratricopeptide (TPR) repeat protein